MLQLLLSSSNFKCFYLAIRVQVLAQIPQASVLVQLLADGISREPSWWWLPSCWYGRRS